MTLDFEPPPGNPEVLATAASRLRQTAGLLAAEGTSLALEVAAAHSSWVGPRGTDLLAVGDGVRDQVDDAASHLDDLAAAVGELGRRLERATVEVAELRTRAALLDALAPARELLVHQAAEVRRDYRTTALHLAARIDSLSSRASSAALASAARRVHGSGTPPGWALLSGWLEHGAGGLSRDADLPKDLRSAGPERVARWWSRLLPAHRVDLLRHHSAVLGNLDGLPGWARDLANRVQLPRLRARLEHELTDPPSLLGGLPGDGVVRALDRWSPALRDNLRALDAVETVLARGGRQLLGLDPDSGRLLRAVVAIGDVDTADNVSVFVPGFTTRVETSLSGYDHDLRALKSRADRAAYRFAKGRAPRTTAFVAWLGYDAPQPLDVANGPLSVASSFLARRGGEHLADFLRGINAARPGDPHLVTLGHSYGSTTTGYALRHRRTGVDDAVVFGSPGWGVSRAAQLRVPAGHLFAIEADHDPVADLPRFGGVNPDHLPGVTLLSADADPVAHTTGSTGHSAYLVDRSTSQHNLALVSLGHPEKAVLAGRQPFSLLSLVHP